MEIGGYIGAYRLEQPIGEGGMGAVWKARHPTLDRPVALKLIRSEVKASPQAREAFLREVRALSRLHGPQIVQVTDFGFTGSGDPYMVTEFLEGEDLLARVRRRGPLDPIEAIGIGVEVLKALSEAHLVGLVHRDLKPGNVFLQKLAGGARTAVKVLDFGVAKLLEGDEEDTLWPGARLKGSPRYMSPEQVRGGPITPATDIYAFGAMMYRVLTGKPLFGGDRDSVLRAHIELEPPPMNGRAPGLAIPDELEDIVNGCLEKQPEHRPGSAGALQARMERLARALEDTRGGSDDSAPSDLALDWSMAADGDALDAGAAGASGSLPVLGGNGGADVGDRGDLGDWFRTTGEVATPPEGASDSWSIDPPSSPSAPSPSAPSPPEPSQPEPSPSRPLGAGGMKPPTGGWQLDLSDEEPPAADDEGWGVVPPSLEAALAVDSPATPSPSTAQRPGGTPAGGADSNTPAANGSRPSGPDPSTAGLELDLAKGRAPAIAGSMSGVEVPTGGLELQTGADDDGLELAFEPTSRAAQPPQADTPEPETEPAEPPEHADTEDDPPTDVDEPEAAADVELARTPGRPAPALAARVDAAPWHEEHQIPLIAGGGVLLLLILVWFGRSALIGGVEPVDVDAAAIVDAEPRKLDLGTIPLALDRGVAMLEAPSVARGPAAHNGAPSAEQRPTVLIRPDPPPATFTRLDTDEVVCEEAATCRVPIDVDIKITRKGYRRLILKGDDLYDRRGSTWRVILRR